MRRRKKRGGLSIAPLLLRDVAIKKHKQPHFTLPAYDSLTACSMERCRGEAQGHRRLSPLGIRGEKCVAVNDQCVKFFSPARTETLRKSATFSCPPPCREKHPLPARPQIPTAQPVRWFRGRIIVFFVRSFGWSIVRFGLLGSGE